MIKLPKSRAMLIITIVIFIIIILISFMYIRLDSSYTFEENYIENLTNLVLIIIDKGEFNLLKDIAENENVEYKIIEESERINGKITTEREYKIKEIINKNNKYYVEIKAINSIDGFLTYFLEFVKKDGKFMLHEFFIDK